MAGWKVAAWVLLFAGVAVEGTLVYTSDVWVESVQPDPTPMPPVPPDTAPDKEPPANEPVAEPGPPDEPSGEPGPSESPEEPPGEPTPPAEPEEPKVADLTDRPPPKEEPEEPPEPIPPEPIPEGTVDTTVPPKPIPVDPSSGDAESFTLLFETGRIRLEPPAKRKMWRVVKKLKDDPELVLSVEGHADQRGPEDKNYNLSNLRAKVVVLFVRNRGIRTDRVQIEAYGETRPLVEANTPRAWEKNRRVVVHLHKGEP
jgi:peptidoglycan-associated lipoprotein